MARTNSHIRQFLEKQGYTDLTFFPNNRFFKDVWIGEAKFDAVCVTPKSKIAFIQAKTNMKCSKKDQTIYEAFPEKYGVQALWITRFDGGNIEIWPKS